MQIPFPILWLCLLTGCGGLTASAEFPPSATQPAPLPTVLPNRAINDQEIEVYWGRDRAALLQCGGQIEVLSGRAMLPPKP